MSDNSSIMTEQPDSGVAEIRALNQAIVVAPDPQIRRIVATVDALAARGQADQLIVPLRHRLAALQPPHPLRFPRLLLHPLDPLIVPVGRWRREQQAIPRAALRPIAEHVRLMMGSDAAAIEAATAGHTTADIDLIIRLGRSLWPAAAKILAGPTIPRSWGATDLGDDAYRPLADLIATLLTEAVALDALCAETAGGMLPPPAESIEAMMDRVAHDNPAALPMTITLLLNRLPDAADLLAGPQAGPAGGKVHAAMDQAADLLLGQLDRPAGTETRIATGSLAEAGAAVSRMVILLEHLRTANLKPRRRERLRAVRQRLEAGCRTRFSSGLQDEVLAPLRDPDTELDPAAITTLEAAARGLRVLETEARVMGSGASYDLLLGDATEVIKRIALRDRLSLVDKLRLIEILGGSDAALALLDYPA